MRIGELAREGRPLTSAIRYYEREGLVPVAGGQTLVTGSTRGRLLRLRFIRRAKTLGLSRDGDQAARQFPRCRRREGCATRSPTSWRRRGAGGTNWNRWPEPLSGSISGSLGGPRCSCRHVGDCDCIPLEPMPEEVITMATELEQVKAAVCSCGCEMCATSGTNCGCGCCGVSVAGSEPKSGASKALSQIPLVEASATCTCGCCA